MNSQFTPEQEEWLQALESGKYKQGRKWLNKGGNMCCLGVACELFKDKLNLSVVDCGSSNSVRYYDSESNAAPHGVVDLLHLGGYLGQASGEGFRDLYQLNDEDLLTFPEIASHIRKHPGQYFTNFSV
jgi:hypothetical protein